MAGAILPGGVGLLGLERFILVGHSFPQGPAIAWSDFYAAILQEFEKVKG